MLPPLCRVHSSSDVQRGNGATGERRPAGAKSGGTEISGACPMTISVPVARPDLSGNEEKYVVDAIRSSWISSTGSYIDRFEREFASLCGTRASIAVCNGTVALHLALLTLDVRRGDEVIVPSLT